VSAPRTGPDHDGAGQPGDDRVGDESHQPEDGAAAVGALGVRGHAAQRGDQVAADDPPDDEVAAGQAVVVTVLQRHDICPRHRAVRGGLGRRDDLFGHAGLSAAVGRGDQQRVGRGGRVDHQRGADGIVTDQAASGRCEVGANRLSYALETMPHGTWGGTTREKRKEMRVPLAVRSPVQSEGPCA
jgi:hypothetical protein